MDQTEKTRNLRVISVTTLLSGLCNSMVQAVWQPFVLSLGAPMSTLGMLESLGGWRGVVTSLLYPVGGWLSDRVGRKPIIMLAGLAGLIAVALYVLAAITGNWLWLLPGVILLGVAFAANPARNSLVAESAQADRRGMAYSILMVSWIAPGILAPSLGGYIADRWDFTPVFLLRLVLESIRLALIVWFLKETLGQTSRVTLHGLKNVLARIFVPPKGLRGFYWALTVDSFVWGTGLALLFGMLSETYGFTTLQLGLMSSALSLVATLSQIPVGRLIDRYGSKRFLVLSEIIGLIVTGGWLFSRSFIAFAALYAFFGLSVSTWVPAQMALLANSVTESERGESMGRLEAFRGVLGFPAPYLAGLLYDHFGFRAPILANFIGVFFALGAVVILVRDPEVRR